MVKGQLIIVMGVSGSGKSVVGEALAIKLNANFIDGDDLHPQRNIDKMAAGIALTDEDRLGWLESIAMLGHKEIESGKTCVIACSALKQQYRDILRAENPTVCFVFLSGDYNLIAKRVEARENHFIHLNMLKSQFETLERPTAEEKDVATVSVNYGINQIVSEIVLKLSEYYRAS